MRHLIFLLLMFFFLLQTVKMRIKSILENMFSYLPTELPTRKKKLSTKKDNGADDKRKSGGLTRLAAISSRGMATLLGRIALRRVASLLLRGIACLGLVALPTGRIATSALTESNWWRGSEAS